jgi:hypothetical protein
LCEITSVAWRFLQPFLERASRCPIGVANFYLVTFSILILVLIGFVKFPSSRVHPRGTQMRAILVDVFIIIYIVVRIQSA